MPACTGIGLTFQAIPRTDTIVGTTTGFSLNGLVQRNFHILTRSFWIVDAALFQLLCQFLRLHSTMLCSLATTATKDQQKFVRKVTIMPISNSKQIVSVTETQLENRNSGYSIWKILPLLGAFSPWRDVNC